MREVPPVISRFGGSQILGDEHSTCGENEAIFRGILDQINKSGGLRGEVVCSQEASVLWRKLWLSALVLGRPLLAKGCIVFWLHKTISLASKCIDDLCDTLWCHVRKRAFHFFASRHKSTDQAREQAPLKDTSAGLVLAPFKDSLTNQ